MAKKVREQAMALSSYLKSVRECSVGTMEQ